VLSSTGIELCLSGPFLFNLSICFFRFYPFCNFPCCPKRVFLNHKGLALSIEVSLHFVFSSPTPVVERRNFGMTFLARRIIVTGFLFLPDFPLSSLSFPFASMSIEDRSFSCFSCFFPLRRAILALVFHNNPSSFPPSPCCKFPLPSEVPLFLCIPWALERFPTDIYST